MVKGSIFDAKPAFSEVSPDCSVSEIQKGENL